MATKTNIAKWLAGAGVSVSAAIGGSYLIIPQEGSVKNKQGLHVSYLDAVGVPSACYGQTGKDLYNRTIKVGVTYTEQECLDMLAKTIIKFDKEVGSTVKTPWKSPYQHASMVSFAYNVGMGNFKSSTLLKKMNAGDHIAACEELSKWVYAQKKKLNGLVKRREVEQAWCMGEVPYEVEVTFDELNKIVASTTDKGVIPKK